MTTPMKHPDTYLDAFHRLDQRAAGHELAWLRQLRAHAFERFSQMGFPTTHDEDWRFTNVSAIARTRFSLPHEGRGRLLRPELLPPRLGNPEARLTFLNGHLVRELSTFPQAIQVSSLKAELERSPDTIRLHLGRYLDMQRDAFSPLNTAFFEDGAYVHVTRGKVIEEPIHLIFVSASDRPIMSHPRNLLVFDEQCEATVVEEYISWPGEVVFSNSATELIAGESTTISHYMIEREHGEAFNISTLRIQQARSANVASHSVLLGGGLVRNNVHPVLAGEGGECLINGLFVGTGREHLDNYMHVEHASPHSTSRQFYNGILDGHAHGVFHGRIVVHKNAQKTDAKQTNRNLLLSDNAQIDTKPQLEIYADDVKCTHGATIGQIDDTALFYLRSRGIEERVGRRLLLMAFAGQCLERMSAGAARSHVEHLIHEHLSLIEPLPGEESEPVAVERTLEEVG
ncbi:MAG: Fe-S cluster assembly protein SufD [Acidobacteria bacterium]|nr:Fe-S cluster assembly protein SufD [Acidobacteriota bacterium]